ncbi:MAG: phosphorylase family protein, partial [Desulforhopalus sp.]
RAGLRFHTGTFITVNSISATRRRGVMLRSRWGGLCENMEGAAVARACREYSIPWLELRCIANFVEDRDPSTWRLQDGCRKAAETALQVIRGVAVR